jgi:hypothetical protein
VRRSGEVTITLRIAKRYDRTLRRAKRLLAQATVEFEARDGTQFERRIGVAFSAPKARRAPNKRGRRG